jgi:hypothetical protein
MERSREVQELSQARTTIISLKCGEYIARILGRHYPKPPLALDLQHVRSPDQVTIAKPPILVFTLVAKNNPNACARPDGNTAEIGGHWHIEALLLSFYNPLEIKICMTFAVKIHI